MKPTRRDALVAGFDAAEKGEPIEPVEQVAEPEVAEPEQKPDKPRAEDGKFVKGEKSAKSDTSAEPVVTEDKYAKPPKSWKQDFHTHYSGLTPEVRAYLHQREEEQNKGVEPLKHKAQRADLLEQSLGPVGQELAQRGIGLDVFLRDIGNTVWTLARGTPEQKRATLLNIAQQYGVNVAQQAAEATQQSNPELDKLRAELHGVRSVIERQHQDRETAEWAQVHNAITQFANDAEKYPHFAAVRVTMGRLIQTGEADSMETAYSKAVRLHDDIWQQEQAKTAADSEAKRKADQDARAKAARASAVSPRTASPAGAGRDDTVSKKGRRSTIEDAFERIAGSGRV